MSSGGAGNDVIGGRAGRDGLFGVSGKDFIRGQEGDDMIRGGANDDFIFGGDNVVVYGGYGYDLLFGSDDTSPGCLWGCQLIHRMAACHPSTGTLVLQREVLLVRASERKADQSRRSW